MTAQRPMAQEGLVCPLHKEDMSKVCHTCPLWVQLRGCNPNTGQEMDGWYCSFTILPAALLEVSKEVRQGAAATESFRNEMVTRADSAREMRLIQAMQEPPKRLSLFGRR